jgi:hypothetical protein
VGGTVPWNITVYTIFGFYAADGGGRKRLTEWDGMGWERWIRRWDVK